jgi:peptidoglycan-associated lipoprotein
MTTLAAGPANNITLSNAANDFSTVAVTTANNISLTDANDIALGTLAMSGSLTLAANGAVTDANGSANNITASSAMLTAGRIGTAGDPLETNVLMLDATSSAGGLFLAQAGPVVLNNVVATGGNVVIGNATGNMTINTVTATGGGVNLTAGGGSILDGNGSTNNITASADSTLQALRVIGVTGDPIEVNVNTGNLAVAASGRIGPVSVIIDGTVSPSNTLVVLNVPPGEVIFNGQVIFPLPGQNGFGNFGQFFRNSNQGQGDQLGNARRDATIVFSNPAVAIQIDEEQEPSDVAGQLTASTLESGPEGGATSTDGDDVPMVASSSFPSLSAPGVGPAMGSSAGEEVITDDEVGAEVGMQAQTEPLGHPQTAMSGLNEVRMQQLPMAASGLEDVFFEYGSWQLKPGSVEGLQRVAEWLKANPTTTVVIEGHADEHETTTYNHVISEQRAEAVQGFLGELGIDRSRLKTVSYGKERPFCQEGGEECRQQNRRSHLVLTQGKSAVQVYRLLPAVK